MNELKEMADDDLVDEFEKTVRYWHYDVNAEKPKFKLDDLREEMLNRMAKN
jgi:hypothetical protein